MAPLSGTESDEFVGGEAGGRRIHFGVVVGCCAGSDGGWGEAEGGGCFCSTLSILLIILLGGDK